MIRRAALVVAAALAVASCGGPATVEALFGEGNTGVMIAMEVPLGWHSRGVGGSLVLAENESDLRSVTTEGPRLTVRSRGRVDPLNEAMAMLPPGADGSAVLRIVTEPRTLEIAGVPAVEVTIEDASGPVVFVRRYLIIHFAGTAAFILVEAPADRWDEAGPMLDDLLQRTLRVGT